MREEAASSPKPSVPSLLSLPVPEEEEMSLSLEDLEALMAKRTQEGEDGFWTPRSKKEASENNLGHRMTLRPRPNRQSLPSVFVPKTADPASMMSKSMESLPSNVDPSFDHRALSRGLANGSSPSEMAETAEETPLLSAKEVPSASLTSAPNQLRVRKGIADLESDIPKPLEPCPGETPVSLDPKVIPPAETSDVPAKLAPNAPCPVLSASPVPTAIAPSSAQSEELPVEPNQDPVLPDASPNPMPNASLIPENAQTPCPSALSVSPACFPKDTAPHLATAIPFSSSDPSRVTPACSPVFPAVPGSLASPPVFPTVPGSLASSPVFPASLPVPPAVPAMPECIPAVSDCIPAVSVVPALLDSIPTVSDRIPLVPAVSAISDLIPAVPEPTILPRPLTPQAAPSAHLNRPEVPPQCFLPGKHCLPQIVPPLATLRPPAQPPPPQPISVTLPNNFPLPFEIPHQGAILRPAPMLPRHNAPSSADPQPNPQAQYLMETCLASGDIPFDADAQVSSPHLIDDCGNSSDAPANNGESSPTRDDSGSSSSQNLDSSSSNDHLGGYDLRKDLQKLMATISVAQLLDISPSTRQSLKNLLAFPSKERRLLVAHFAGARAENIRKFLVAQNFIDCVLDGGANCNLISLKTAVRLKLKIQKQRNIFITTIDASTLALGVVKGVPVGLGQNAILVDFVVLENATFECLLGRPFLKKSEAQAEWKTNSYSFCFNGVRFTLPGNIGEEEDLQSFALQVADPIKELLTLYPSLFVDSSENCRECAVTHHAIDTGDALPVRQKLRRKSPKEEERIAEHVQELLKNGIVERGSGPWAANIFGVPKGTGGTRYVIDFRHLNEVTKKHAYPLPNIDILLDQLAGSVVFSTLDLFSGYYQVPVAPEDKEKTGFITSNGLFQFRRMPFGLTNAPATFQAMMEVVLEEFLGKFVTVYIDDITVYSRSLEEHRTHIKLVCDALDRACLSVNLKKCQFFKTEVKILGFQVSSQGIAIDEGKIRLIQSLKEPKGVADLRSILGVLSWLRRFVPNFAKIAVPLTSLLSKSAEWKWENEQEIALETLKKAFVENAVLVFPDFSKPFDLTTDASGKAIGAVLLQEGKIVHCVSRALSAAERNYTTTEKECLAIVFAIKKLRYYLFGNQVTILTDHRCLTSVLKLKDPTGRIARWMLAISEISPQIKYIPGSLNALADRMSRLSVHLAEESYCLDLVEDLLRGRRNLLDVPAGIRKLAARLVGKYFIQNEKLYRNMSGRPAVQVIKEKQMRRDILEKFHNQAGHFGTKSTFEGIFAFYWWPDLYQEVKAHVSACQICQRNGRPIPQKATGKVLLSGILDKWGIDFVKMPLTSSGNQYLIVAVEYVSNLVIARATQHQDSATVKSFLLEEIILQFGAPLELVSDNGLCFASRDFMSFLEKFQIKRCPTTTYHPQANGRCERMNGVLTKLLGNLSREKHAEWDRLVKLALLILKMKTNTVTGMSPFSCLFGISSRQLDLELDRLSQPPTFNLKERLNEIHNLESQREQIIGKFNSQPNPDNLTPKHCFLPNDLVLVHTPAIKDNSKLKQPWAGPYRVHQVYPNGNVRLSSADQTQIFPQVTNFAMLRPYYPDADAVMSSRTNSHPRGEEFVAELQKRPESWKTPQQVPRQV